MPNLTTAELAAAFRAAPAGIHQRSIDRTVTLHEGEDGGKTVAELTTRHNKDNRVFMSSIRIVRQEPPRDGSMFRVTTWIPFERTHNRRLPNIPVARYSAKALEAADAEALELLTNEPDWLDCLDLGPYQGTL